MNFETGHNQEFSSVTQCPYCDTAFHIGLSQLDTADGRVRCGGCLRVFNAKEHFLVEQKRLFDDLPGRDQDQTPGDELPAAADQSPTPDQGAPPEDADPFSKDLLGAEIVDEEGPIILGDFDHHSGISIPRDAILKEEVDEFRQQDYEPASAHEVLGDIDSLESSELEQGTDPEPVQHPAQVQNTESKKSSELLEDLQQLRAELADENSKDSSELRSEPEPEQNQQSDSKADTLDPLTEALIEPEADHAVETEPAIENGEVSSESLSDVDKSPHPEFFIGPSNKNKGRNKPIGTIWWAGLCLLILALPMQLIYQQPAELVEKPWFRRLATHVCTYIGCDIPVYINIEAIKISGFIEPHSEYQNSLIAKIDLRNTAISEQPFPAIAIFFRSLNGRITASREFQPQDYLRGEARAYKAMPVDRNIQLELEFLDPGEQSTSYEMFVRESPAI